MSADYPHHFATGRCWVCARPISFDPLRVPSMPLDADGEPARTPEEIVTRMPLCRQCVVTANPVRRDEGLPTWDDREEIWETVRGLPE